MYKTNLIDKLGPLWAPGESLEEEFPPVEKEKEPLPKEKSEDIINYFKQEEVVKWLAMYGDK